MNKDTGTNDEDKVSIDSAARNRNANGNLSQ